LYPNPLINVNAHGPELFLCVLNFSHQFLVCFWYIVEGEDAVAEFEEKVCAKGYEGPKGELEAVVVSKVYLKMIPNDGVFGWSA
jgi:hypothetical protein